MKKGPTTYYRLFDHTADLGMEIFGASAQQLFVNAAKALFETIAGSPDHRDPIRHQLEIAVEGVDWADLMVNWLRELLYLWNGQQQILLQLEIQSLCETHMHAIVTTHDFDPAKHRIDKEIKAVTYHQIEVAHHANGWRARVIFDV